MANDFAEGFFETADGPRLHFLDYAPRGAEKAPPILCLHGLTRNVRDFTDLAPRISHLGHRVIVASQRGRGRSARDPQPERYNVGVYTADMFALLDRLGVARAGFIGTSMGGLITLLAAHLAPSRVAAAVLNDVGPEIDPRGLARIRGYAGAPRTARSWTEAAKLTRGINGAAFPGETSDGFWLEQASRVYRQEAPDRLVLDYDPLIAQSLKPQSSDTMDLWPFFDALKPIPTLIIRGEISDVLMLSTVEEMRRRKPDLAIATVANVGHAPLMIEAEAWVSLEAFLGSII